MRILIVSHNPIGRTNNMGKTLRAYFQGFRPEELAQFYLHPGDPSDPLCQNYYRFTDTDALRSLFSKRVRGSHLTDISPEVPSSGNRRTPLRLLYRWGQTRTAPVYALRDLLWKFSRWNSPELLAWANAFSPEVVFLAAGDYGCLYNIALALSMHTGAPLAVCCVDDFYLHCRNPGPLGRLVHRRFLKTVGKTMDRAGCIFTICDSLAKEYGPLFSRPCFVLHTPAQAFAPAGTPTGRVVYLGNLELGRPAQLIAIGRTLQRLPSGPKYLDVWSSEDDPKILKAMTKANGIRFHGAASAGEAAEILGTSLLAVHTESFDPKFRAIVRHSVSAKIPDLLARGGCILAYGPEEAASMDYLQKHGAACCVTRPEDLEKALEALLTDAALRGSILSNARRLARENHGSNAGSDLLRRHLGELVRNCHDCDPN